MTKTATFFDNSLIFGDSPIFEFSKQRIKNLLFSSVYFKKAFMLVSFSKQQIILSNHNPIFFSLFNDITQRERIDENAILEKIPESEQALFSQYISIINSYMLNNCAPKENIFYFTFNLPLITTDNTLQMIRFMIFPYHYADLLGSRVPQIIYYQFGNSEATHAGNLTLHHPTKKQKQYFLLSDIQNEKSNYAILKESDLSIFELSSKGFSEIEIAEALSISLGTLKHIKSTILLQLNAQSTSQIIAMLSKQGIF
jgi:DNA-binding CsgD family transcriptional regulator